MFLNPYRFGNVVRLTGILNNQSFGVSNINALIIGGEDTPYNFAFDNVTYTESSYNFLFPDIPYGG